MDVQPGKYTVETFAQQYGLKRQSALNKLSKLKEQGLVSVSGGGSQKRIYSVFRVPKEPTSGFYDLIN